MPRAHYARLPWAKDLPPSGVRNLAKEERAKRTNAPPGPLVPPMRDGKEIEEPVDLEDIYCDKEDKGAIELMSANGVRNTNFLNRISKFKRFGALCFALKQPKE